jgi:hypothetical protein
VNLFWSTRALTASREDHLTEFIAAALDVSDGFRSAFADHVLSDFAESRKWPAPQIQSVRTQVSFAGTTCCPDMILTLSDGRTIACEHKLDALETMGPGRDRRPQLKRYLDLPIDGLLYVRTSWNPPVSNVLNHQKYIRPSDREHFLWRDFYPLLSHGQHVLLDWLSEGFERLGFTPPHPSIGNMSGQEKSVNRANRRNFAKLWRRARSLARTLGWKVSAGSIVELYLTGNPASLASWVFISPAKFERFLFRVTPQQGELNVATMRLQRAVGLLKERAELVQRDVTRKDGKESVVDIITSLHELLGTEPLSAEEIEDRLLGFTEPLLQAIQK